MFYDIIPTHGKQMLHFHIYSGPSNTADDAPASSASTVSAAETSATGTAVSKTRQSIITKRKQSADQRMISRRADWSRTAVRGKWAPNWLSSTLRGQSPALVREILDPSVRPDGSDRPTAQLEGESDRHAQNGLAMGSKWFY